MFFKSKIIKDIVQDAILTILICKYDKNELNKNFSFISIEEVSNIPLINLPFACDIKGDKSADLNKITLTEIAISNIPLYAYEKNMKVFIKNYEKK